MIKQIIATDKKILFIRLLLATLVLLDLVYAKLSYPEVDLDQNLFQARFSISLLLITILIATFFYESSNKWFQAIFSLCIAGNTLFELFLLFFYDFHYVNVSEFFFTILITALLWTRIKHVTIYLLITASFFIYVNLVVGQPFFDVMAHGILILLYSLIVYVFCVIKIYFENKFKHRGDMLKHLFHDSNESMVLADLKTGMLDYFNHAAQQLFELSTTAVAKKHDMTLFFQEKGHTLNIPEISDVIKARGSYFTTMVLKRKTGDVFYGNLYIKPVTEDDRPKWLIRILDLTEQQQATLQLQENWKVISRVLDAIPHKIFLKDPEHKFLIVNKTVELAHGQTKGFFEGKTDHALFPEEKANAFMEQEKEVMATGKSITFTEEKVIMADGSEKVFQITKMPFYLDQHQKNGIFGLGIDITQISNYQEKLRKSEASYRMLMEQASDGIYSADKYGIITDANPKACQMLGYTKGELVGSNVKSLTDKDDRIFNVEMINFNEKKSLIVERKFKKKDGNSFMVELSVTILDDGGHQGIMRDITERKRMEKVLQDNEKKFRALIESSYDITAILEESLNVSFISPSVLKILGYMPKKLEGRTPFDLIHPEDKDLTEKYLRSILVSPKEFKILPEIRVRSFNGNYRYFEVAGSNMLGDSAIQGLVINLHDISERKNTETQLLNTNFELDSFVYRVSHDIKAPLRSVMGLIGIAKLENKQPEITTYLDMMNKSVLNLDQFIKDLTLFSRNSRLELEMRKIDFVQVVNDCIENLKFMDYVEKVEIRKNIKPNIFFYSDLTRINTIIGNLLSNSLKYHKFEPSKSFVNISITEESNQIVIEVEDNGVGINPVYHEKIFEMFFRASEKSYGSGLGLYIVKTAVKKLKGTITVHSIPDEGTKFKVVLPRLTVTNNNG